jgi:hypothetical protein
VDVSEEDKAAPSADADHSQALESFRALCGDADCDALKGLLEKASAGAEADVSPVILSPDADKAHRSVGLIPQFQFLVVYVVEIGGNGVIWACFFCRRCIISSRGASSFWSPTRSNTMMEFRDALGCGWDQELGEGGVAVGEVVVGGEGRGRTWVVLIGEMTGHLIAEDQLAGQIMLGSS